MSRALDGNPPAATLTGAEKLAGIQAGIDVTLDVSDVIALAGAAALPGLALKANDADVVHDTGNETIAGIKTFSAGVIVPANSLPQGAVAGLETAIVNRPLITDVVLDTGDQTVAGVKTFSAAPVVPDGSWSIAKTTGLQAALDDLAARALDVKDAAATSTQRTVVGNGLSKPLSGFYGTDLAAAQAAYPHVSALTDELDWAVIQATLNTATGGVTSASKRATNAVFMPAGAYVVNRRLEVRSVTGFHWHGAGAGVCRILARGTFTRSVAGDGDVISLDGLYTSSIGGFSVEGFTGSSPLCKNVIHLWWQAGTVRSTNNVTFRDITVGIDGSFFWVNAFAVETVDGLRQNDDVDFYDCAATGYWYVRDVTNKALTSNVATLTTDVAHTFVVGSVVTVSGVDATFNGTHTVTAVPSPTNFSFAKTAADVASTPVAFGALVEQATYWQAGFVSGSGVVGNVLDIHYYGCASLHNAKGAWWNGSCGGIHGFQAVGNGWDTACDDPTGQIVVDDVRSEEAQRLFVGSSAIDVVTNVRLSSCDFAGTRLHPDGYVIYPNNAGLYTFEQLTFHTVRTGPVIKLRLTAPGASHLQSFVCKNIAAPVTRTVFFPASTATVLACDGYIQSDNADRTTVAIHGRFAYNSDVEVNSISKGLRIAEGAGAKMGVATLSGGTVTVANTSVTANSRFILTAQSLGTVTSPKAIAVTARSVGVNFTITSEDPTDTSPVGWIMFEPA